MRMRVPRMRTVWDGKSPILYSVLQCWTAWAYKCRWIRLACDRIITKTTTRFYTRCQVKTWYLRPFNHVVVSVPDLRRHCSCRQHDEHRLVNRAFTVAAARARNALPKHLEWVHATNKKTLLFKTYFNSFTADPILPY